MNRRSFTKHTALGVTAALLPQLGFPKPPDSKYKMGLQLYSIRDAMVKDPFGSLKKVKDLGYEDLELYGYNAEEGSYYGFKAKSFKNILDDYGLTTSSGHYNFSSMFMKKKDELAAYTARCIEGALVMDKKYITWPFLAPEYRNLGNYKLLADKLNRIGEQVRGSGLEFAYHNHGFEFTDHHGETGYDIILRDTDPELVKLQMDLYWVMHSSKQTPKELVASQPGRYVMWHIKDMDKVSRDYTELGNGSIDYTQIMPDPKLSGLEYYYLEQGGNYARNSMQSIADSADFFKKNLQHLL